jgi:hypothetical protein
MVARALGFSISTSRLLTPDLNTGTVKSNHYEVFLSSLTSYSSVLICTQLIVTIHYGHAPFSSLCSQLLCTALHLWVYKQSQSQSCITIDGQSPSLSWNKTSVWGLRPDLNYCQAIACLLMWGVLSDERLGMSFAMYNVQYLHLHFYIYIYILHVILRYVFTNLI